MSLERWRKFLTSREIWMDFKPQRDLPMVAGAGNRFFAFLQFDRTKGLSSKHPMRPVEEGMGIVPPREWNIDWADVHLSPIELAVILDSERKIRIDLAELLPVGWKLFAVELTEELSNTIKATLGKDVKTLEGQKWLRGQMPVVPSSDVKHLLLPIYRLAGHGNQLDLDAEHIVYAFGLANAFPERAGTFHEAHRFAREYTRRILGGKVPSDEVSR